MPETSSIFVTRIYLKLHLSLKMEKCVVFVCENEYAVNTELSCYCSSEAIF